VPNESVAFGVEVVARVDAERVGEGGRPLRERELVGPELAPHGRDASLELVEGVSARPGVWRERSPSRESIFDALLDALLTLRTPGRRERTPRRCSRRQCATKAADRNGRRCDRSPSRSAGRSPSTLGVRSAQRLPPRWVAGEYPTRERP